MLRLAAPSTHLLTHEIASLICLFLGYEPGHRLKVYHIHIGCSTLGSCGQQKEQHHLVLEFSQEFLQSPEVAILLACNPKAPSALLEASCT